MGFGQNPHVAKAEAAEQRALATTDDRSRRQSYRDAAHQWDRAAAREKQDARRAIYADNAELARAHADGSELPPASD